MENLYDVMLNQLYPRVSEAERLAEEASGMVRNCEKLEWGEVSEIDDDIWRRIKHVDGLEDSITMRELEMMDDETPDPDGYREEAIRELMSLECRVRRASDLLLEAWKVTTDRICELHEQTVRECEQMKLELEETEKLLKAERNCREKYGWNCRGFAGLEKK